MVARISSSLWFVFLLLCSGSLHAQDYEKIAPKTLPPTKQKFELPTEPAAEISTDDKALVQELKGIIFVYNTGRIIKAGRPGVVGVQADDVKFLKTSAFNKLMGNYLGKQVSLKSLNRLAQDVVVFCRKNHHPVVDVSVPEQDITSGVVQVVVIEGKINEIKAEGNRWTSSKFLVSQIHLRPGEAIDSESLEEDINWLNSNPFRQVDVVFTPGKWSGQTDVVLKTKDRFPARFYMGYEDSGNDLTGDERFLAGFNLSYGYEKIDHQLNYQYTGDGNLNKLNAHSGSYTAALPWRHRWTLYGSHAKTKADIVSPLFSLEGYSWQISTRYLAPLPSLAGYADSNYTAWLRDYTHEARVGLDAKESNNNLEFGGTRVFNTTTDILQWNLGYTGNLRDRWGGTSMGMDFFFSPGGLGDNNDDKSFRASRQFTKAEYYYQRFSLERFTRLPWGMTSTAKALFQVSDVNLLGSEQLGIGGYSSVRGYDEREANGDDGFLFSTELRSPSISPMKMMGIGKWKDQLLGLAFFDMGDAELHQALPGEDPSKLLASVGPGVRYSVNPYLSIRSDYGMQLTDSGNNRRYNSRVHFGLVLSY